MPAVNEDAPIKIAVNVHKDGKPVVAMGVPPPRTNPGDRFGALANNRRIVPPAPPAPTQIFNPVAPRPGSDASSSYLDGDDDDDFSDEDDDEGDSVDSRGFRGMEEDAERIKASKSECLQKLHRYSQQGFPGPRSPGHAVVPGGSCRASATASSGA